MKNKYKIIVYGCDDSTEIDYELNDKELSLVEDISKKVSNTSSYQCMPTMEVKKAETQ